MALENVGLGGVLTFDEKAAVAGMRSAGSAADKFSGQFGAITNVAKAVGEGLGQLGASMGKLGLAATPLTVAFGFGFKQAADFEKQMSAVSAVSQASATDMAILEATAKKFGATTAFSATEAGQGMEFLARAGFSVQEQVAAIGPVLNAASADGIDLATSADIVSNTLKGLGLPATEAARAADVLALASAKTNTNMTELGEAMRYASPQAKTLGIDLETTTAILGAAADAGLKGSIGGSSFTQALIKLAKPTKEGAALLEKFHITMTKTKTGGLDMVDVFKQIHSKVQGVGDVMERARIVEELFGVRGQKAFTSVETAIDTGKIDTLVAQLNNAEGAAERMAATRLDNFAGQVTLLKSAIEGFSNETAGRFLDVAKESIQNYTKGISDVVLVLQELNSEQGLTEATATAMGPTIVGIAKGIKEGIDTVIDAWRTFRDEVIVTIKQFTGGQSSEMIQQFTKIATIIFVVTAALAPVLVTLGGIVLFITSVVVPAFTALGGIIAAAFWPVTIGVGVAVAAFLLLRNEGESVGDTFTRIVDSIAQGFNWLMETIINPIVDGIRWAVGDVFVYVGEQVMDFFSSLHDTFANLIGAIVHIAETFKPIFIGIFTVIGAAIGVIANAIGFAFTTAMWVVQGVVKGLGYVITTIIDGIAYAVRGVATVVGALGEALGLEWAGKVRKWGQADFEAGVPGQVAAQVKKNEPEKKLAEQAISKAELAQLDKEAQNELLAMQVGKAVGDNMPKEINVESKVCVDGKTVATATAKHKQELSERAGFKATPWQRRAAVEHGAAPVGGI